MKVCLISYWLRDQVERVDDGEALVENFSNLSIRVGVRRNLQNKAFKTTQPVRSAAGGAEAI